jgi:DNA-binding MarR family transcriptional regulator
MPRTIRNPSNIIIEVLSMQYRATWAELLVETQLSKGTLSKYLSEMIKHKKIRTETDTSKRPPKTLYLLVDPAAKLKKILEKKKDPFFPDKKEDWEELEPDYVAFAILVGHLISTLKDREIAKRLLKDYLEFTTSFLFANIFAGLEAAYICSDIHGRGSNDKTGKTREPGEQIEEILQLWKKNHEKFDVDPILEAIFWAIFKNADVAFEVKEPVVLSFGNEIYTKMDKSVMGKFIDEIVKVKKEATEKLPHDNT